jgi:tetratricopeptide (TPR) repeat protein/tRNA A-37 threonylcarbamoyl transferase component Bud32
MGAVFLARQIPLDRLVALKLCGFGVATTETMRRRFETEGRALAKLRHPNVVPVISQGEQDGILYLVMEYVAGPSLADLLSTLSAAGSVRAASEVADEILIETPEAKAERIWKRDPARLDRRYIAWVIDLLRQVADGLTAIHAAGIIHRDIKPANIVIDQSGKPKIVDFGLARAGVDPSTTQTGEFFGTPAYASPEQLRGEQAAITGATDIFSFGILLYECLCLQRPFSGQSSADVGSAILADDPPLLRKVVKTTPWELEAITDKCLRKTPSARYPSAGMLSEDLRRFLDNRSILAKKATPARRLARAARRRPWMAASLALLMLLTLVGGAALSQARRVSAERVASENEQHCREAIAAGDASLFRLLVAERPIWMESLLRRTRQEGLIAYSKAIALAPDDIWPLMQRGRLYASQQETLPLAMADFRRAATIEPTFRSARAYLQYVVAEGAGGQSDDAVETFDAVGSSDPNDLYWLGTLHALVRLDPEPANDCYSKCLLLNPNHYWARVERVLYAAEPNVNASMVTASRIEQLRIAKTIRPDLPFASETLASLLRAVDSKQARAELDALIRTFGLSVIRAHALADFELENGDYLQSRKILLEVKDEDLEGGTAGQLGDVARQFGETDEAIHWYEIARRESVISSPFMLADLAEAYSSLGRFEDAEAAYREALAIVRESSNWKSSTSFIYLDYAHWLEQQVRIDDANGVFAQLEECELLEGLPYVEYADSLVRQFRPEDAIAVLKHGIEVFERGMPTGDGADKITRQIMRGDLHKLQGQLVRVFMSIHDTDQAGHLVLQLWEDRPYTIQQTQILIDLLNDIGRTDDALLIARMGEFAETLDANPEQIGWVDTQLKKTKSNQERLERFAMRRAAGVRLEPQHYVELAVEHHDLGESLKILKEATAAYPDSYVVLAAAAIQHRLNGDDDLRKAKLAAAVDCYIAEVRKLVQWSAWQGGAQPTDYISRRYAAIQPDDFFFYCFLAAGDGDASDIAERLEKALVEIGGDSAIVLQSRLAAAKVLSNAKDEPAKED